jgi:hypothetical protein
MNGRVLIVVVTGCILVAGTLFVRFSGRSRSAMSPAQNAYVITESRNASEIAAGIAVRCIRENPDRRGMIPDVPATIFGRAVSVRADDAVVGGAAVVRIEAVATIENHHETTAVYIEQDSLRGAAPR